MTHRNSPSDTLGTIEWEITEAPDWRTIYRGSRDIERENIEISRVADDDWPPDRPKPWIVSAWERVFGTRNLYRKRIHLEGDFYVRLVDRLTERRQRLRVFGMVAAHETTPTFSWEWFYIDGREHARNQEGGRLRIEVRRGRSEWEIGYTEFLTDVWLRMQVKDEIGPFGATRTDPEPRWRVLIARGSRVTWPSLDELER